MLQVRRSRGRGDADHGGPRPFHGFSLAGYHDPDWMEFSLRFRLAALSESADFAAGAFGATAPGVPQAASSG
jgi:hypothetical protein